MQVQLNVRVPEYLYERVVQRAQLADLSIRAAAIEILRAGLDTLDAAPDREDLFTDHERRLSRLEELAGL